MESIGYKTFQGDVDIRQIDSVPKSARKLETRTVMYGEATGHHHTFSGGQVQVYEPVNGETMPVRNGEEVPVQKYVQVMEDATLTHQEHGPQTIPKGSYAILQERQYDVLGKQLRRVID